MEPCHCGHVPADGDRLCSACGRSVGPDGGFGGELLELEPSSVSTSSSVTVERSPLARWGAIGAVVAVGALILGLVNLPSSEPQPEQAAEDVDESAEEEVTADEEEAAPEPIEESVEEEPSDEVDTSVVEPVAEEPAPGEPLLGEETGLVLISGGLENELRLLDLDTGEEIEFPARGWPRGVLGGHLVFTDGNGVFVADLAAPGEPVESLAQPGDGFVEFVGIDDDLIWLLRGAGVSADFSLESYTVDGDRQSQQPVDPWLSLRSSGTLAGDLLNGSAGGVYRRDGEEYRREADGRTLANGERLVLLHQCDDALVCTNRWVERFDLAVEVELPVPEVDFSLAYELVGGDRWLVETDWVNGTARLLDVETGEELPVEIPGTFTAPGFGSFGVSDSGRWMVINVAGMPRVVDLESSAEFDLPGSIGGSGASIFVDQEALG